MAVLKQPTFFEKGDKSSQTQKRQITKQSSEIVSPEKIKELNLAMEALTPVAQETSKLDALKRMAIEAHIPKLDISALANLISPGSRGTLATPQAPQEDLLKTVTGYEQALATQKQKKLDTAIKAMAILNEKKLKENLTTTLASIQDFKEGVKPAGSGGGANEKRQFLKSFDRAIGEYRQVFTANNRIMHELESDSTLSPAAFARELVKATEGNASKVSDKDQEAFKSSPYIVTKVKAWAKLFFKGKIYQGTRDDVLKLLTALRTANEEMYTRSFKEWEGRAKLLDIPTEILDPTRGFFAKKEAPKKKKVGALSLKEAEAAYAKATDENVKYKLMKRIQSFGGK